MGGRGYTVVYGRVRVRVRDGVRDGVRVRDGVSIWGSVDTCHYCTHVISRPPHHIQ